MRGYLRKLGTYASPGYWGRVRRIHGKGGIRAEVTRILTPTAKEVRRSALHFDPTELTEDPIEALQLATERGDHSTPLLNAPVARLRHRRLGIATDDLSHNPFTVSVAEHLSGRHRGYPGSALHRFYREWVPETLADFLGVEPASRSSPLHDALIVDLLPWEPAADRDRLRWERDAYELEREAKLGRAPGGRHGYDHFGPTSDALGRYRYAKHRRVADDFAAGNYNPLDHTFSVQLLLDGTAWAALVWDGRHRTTALAALGYDRLTIAVPAERPPIRRSEAAMWPGVVAGLYTVDEALSVFDRFVAGPPPTGFPRFGPVMALEATQDPDQPD